MQHTQGIIQKVIGSRAITHMTIGRYGSISRLAARLLFMPALYVYALCIGCSDMGDVINTRVNARLNARRNIERVLAEDSTTIDNASSISEIVRRKQAILLSGCPTEFKQAYIAHIEAWQKAAAVEREAKAMSDKYNSFGTFVEAFLRGMVFDFGMLDEVDEELQRLRREWEAACDDISTTFQMVQSIAVEYGARLPQRSKSEE